MDAADPIWERLRIVPANEASWDDLDAVFGMRGYAGRCRCGLIAYLDGEPVSWAAVEPRIAHPKLRTTHDPLARAPGRWRGTR